MTILANTGQDGQGSQGSPPTAGSGAPPATSGNQTPPAADWRSGLSDEFKSHAALKDFKDINGLAKSYVHAQSMIGADKLVIPAPDAPAAVRDEFYKKLGRPDGAQGYDVKPPEGVKPEQLDTKRVDFWRGKLFEAGIPKAQGEALINAYLTEEFSAINARQEAVAKQLSDWDTSLRQELGTKYDETVTFAKLGISKFGSDAVFQAINDAGFGNHPDLVKMFANIGRAFSDSGPRDGGNRGPNIGTPEGAIIALREFESNAANLQALHNARDPRHDQVVAERARLFKLAYPPTTT